MTPSDFQESEFRGSLNNQLTWGSELVWEPSQVFEKHIGMERAAYVTNPLFWGIHGLPAPLGEGVSLDYEWYYVWKKRVLAKSLPDFSHNLFIQAKRPLAGAKPRGRVKKEGISGDYWKFEISPHQQQVLERLGSSLGDTAIVCYAAPAFHTQWELYNHTTNASMVQNSSFPLVSELAGCTAWYYEKGGASGLASPEFMQIESADIETRIARLALAPVDPPCTASQSLQRLSDSVLRSSRNIPFPSAADTWFQASLQKVEHEIAERAAFIGNDEDYVNAVRSFAQVKAFCTAYHLDWLVVGKGI
jgi:hypothetical protein